MSKRRVLVLLLLLFSLVEVVHLRLAAWRLHQQEAEQQQQDAQRRQQQQQQQEADEAAARLRGQRLGRQAYLATVQERVQQKTHSNPDNAPKALQFQRPAVPGLDTQPSEHAYHAPLSVFVSPTVLAATPAEAALHQAAVASVNAAMRAYSPAWLVFADSPDTADVVLQHAIGCIASDSEPATTPSADTAVPTVLLQHSLQGCSASSSSGQAAQPLQAWARALLVVSPFNLELHVQRTAPEVQPQLRLWSMAWGANQQLLTVQQSGQEPSKGRNTTRRVVVSFGSLPAADAISLVALLTAAAEACYTLVFVGQSQTLIDLCGSSLALGGQDSAAQQPAATIAASRKAPALCRHLRHVEQADKQQLVRFIESAGYVALLHETEAWQDGAAAAVLLGKRLLLYNMTLPHQPYRWLRPYAALIEPARSSHLLLKRLHQALAHEPQPLQELLRQRAVGQLSWHVLVPRLFDRIHRELRLLRFPSLSPASFQGRQPLPATEQLAQQQIQALTEACAAGQDTVLHLNQSSRLVVLQDMEQHLSQPSLHCPAIILLIGSFDRSIGTCQDAAQLALYWDVPLVPAALLLRTLPRTATAYHQHCRGSVVLSLGIAYNEVLSVMRLEPAGTPAANHKYWFMPNHDIMNKWHVNSSVVLIKAADRILCKTRACQQLVPAWLEHNGPSLPRGAHETLLTSFSTPDPLAGPLSTRPSSADFTRFLHAMGKSPYKGTAAVVEAWARNPDLPPLTISTYHRETIDLIQGYLNNSRGLGFAPLNLQLVTERMSVPQLNNLTTGIGMHLCPSEKEGYGHIIAQAQAAEALLLTTDYPPMREFAGDHQDAGLLCPYHELADMEVEMFSAVNNPYLPRLAARMSANTIEACVRRALAMSVPQRQQMAARGRQRFLQQQELFRQALKQLKEEAEQLVAAARQGTRVVAAAAVR